MPEGVFQAEQLAIANGRFKTQVTPQQVNLNLFADPNSDALKLTGKLGGKLTVAGRVDNLSPTAVTAQGDLNFSEGIDLLEQPLVTNVAWDGQRLDVLQAKGEGFRCPSHVIWSSPFLVTFPINWQ
ncbi:MAG: hypothetical protein HC930_17395, partial [Hydrococcus sp. SU_1_0]|nr:hypothetical protein [Hydrococcus sp. SU_1_0]